MALMAQDILVGLIVAGCAVFSAWRLMSPSLRLRTLSFLTPIAGKLGVGRPIERLKSKAMGQLAGGCGACSRNRPTPR
jgi:hypothetical protein